MERKTEDCRRRTTTKTPDLYYEEFMSRILDRMAHDREETAQQSVETERQSECITSPPPWPERLDEGSVPLDRVEKMTADGVFQSYEVLGMADDAGPDRTTERNGHLDCGFGDLQYSLDLHPCDRTARLSTKSSLSTSTDAFDT